jgi:ABC-2 type transport system ATP-binding protein
MIVVRGVEKRFAAFHGFGRLMRRRGTPATRPILRDVNLTIGRGELFGLLGPNGAGKTTLLKTMATLCIPDSGSIRICGIDVARDPLAAKRKIGLCTSDERSFYYRLTARQNLRFFGALGGLRGALLKRRIEEAAIQVNLERFLELRFAEFSSGMRQRLTVARALLCDPPILFFDEPTRAVDPIHADELRKLIRHELVDRAGKCVIVATNLLEEAWAICDRVAVINHGAVLACGPPRSLDAQLHRTAQYRLHFAGEEAAIVARIRELSGCTVASSSNGDGTVLLVDCDAANGALGELMSIAATARTALRGFALLEPHPIDVFRQITNDGR